MKAFLRRVYLVIRGVVISIIILPPVILIATPSVMVYMGFMWTMTGSDRYYLDRALIPFEWLLDLY